MPLSLSLSLLIHSARALDPCHDSSTGTDADADGWCEVDTPSDCDDANDAIHPNAAEDGIDNVDDNCDDSVLVHRIFVSEMSSLISAPFQYTGNVSQVSAGGEDSLHFTVDGSNPRISLRSGHELDFGTGEFTVLLRVLAQTGGPTCGVEVTSTSMAAQTQTFTPTAGTHVFSFPDVQPGDEITALIVRCPSGAGTMDLDWMTLQNGDYRFGAMGDIAAASSTMGLPNVARQGLVRSSIAVDGHSLGNLMLAGSEEGGFAWSTDGDEWNTANGTASQWVDLAEGGVWEAWALDNGGSLADQSVVVLTGSKDDASGGGLWITHHLNAVNQSWTLVDGGVGAAKHIDDCGGTPAFKPISSGQLLIAEPGDTTHLLIASQVAGADRGLWVWDTDGGALARPYFNDDLPDALPSALAIDASGAYLLVGYKVVAESSVEHATLYLCPATFAAESGDGCTPVATEEDEVWAGDIRDIEPDPSVTGEEPEPLRPGTFYVADGGRRWDDGTSACTPGEPTVFVVHASGGYPTPTVTIVDTDDAVDDPPDWMDSGSEYYAGDGCLDSHALGAESLGNLVPPQGAAYEGSELSALAIDPTGTWLFAFFPLDDKVREYGCVRTFRVPTEDIVEGTTPWTPFQGWERTQMSFDLSTAHAHDRRIHVETQGALMDSEPLLEDWAGASTHDAAFVHGVGEDAPNLLLGGNFLWRVLSLDASSSEGWDTPTPADPADVDLDIVDWELAWDGASKVFQDANINSIASCPGCQQVSGGVVDMVLAAGVSDYKMATMYARHGATRLPASRPCEVQKVNGGGNDVSLWLDGSTRQGWMGLVNQASSNDSHGYRGLLYAADVTTGEWCWDGLARTAFSTNNYILDQWTFPATAGSDGIWELHCQDSSEVALHWWDACDPTSGGGHPYQMEISGVGHIKRVAAYGDAEALLSAIPGVPWGGGTAVGEGAWQATYASGTGITYLQLPWPAGDLTYGLSTCTQGDFFADDSQVAMVVSPKLDDDGRVHAYLTSRNEYCGVAEVHFDDADPENSSTTEWFEIPLDVDPGDPYTPCTIETSELRGVSIDRDAHWLFVYGGPTSGYDVGGVCAIDLWDGNRVEQAIEGADLDFQVQAVLPHPHVDDFFFAAGIDADAIDATAASAGVYIIQHRYLEDIDEWRWSMRQLSGNDLEHRRVVDLDWGSGDTEGPSNMTHLYAATAGGGVWDLAVTRE